MPRHFSTRHELGNGHYPSLSIVWLEDNDDHGFTGEATFWRDGNTKYCTHQVSVRQCVPLGYLVLTTDPVVYGCWSSTRIPVVRLDEEALCWAGAWAAESLKRKHEATGCTLDGYECTSKYKLLPQPETQDRDDA
jgi:hypothetical protein